MKILDQKLLMITDDAMCSFADQASPLMRDVDLRFTVRLFCDFSCLVLDTK
jgi:hypothetical protein